MASHTSHSQAFDRQFEHSEALLESALEEFAAHGYAQASINRILDAAGMSKGQFYHHFRSKEGLYFALIGVLIQRKRDYLKDAPRPDDLQLDLFQVLERQIRLGIEFAQRQPAVDRFAQSFAREQGNPIYGRVLKRYNFAGDALIDGLVERAHAAGELRSDLPLPFVKHYVSFLFTHAVEVCGLSAAQPTEAVETRLRQLIAAMRSGLAANAPAGAERRKAA